MKTNTSAVDLEVTEDYVLEFRLGKLKKNITLIKTGDRNFMIKKYKDLKKLKNLCSTTLDYYTQYTELYASEFPESVKEGLKEPVFYYEKTLKKLIARNDTNLKSTELIKKSSQKTKSINSESLDSSPKKQKKELLCKNLTIDCGIYFVEDDLSSTTDASPCFKNSPEMNPKNWEKDKMS